MSPSTLIIIFILGAVCCGLRSSAYVFDPELKPLGGGEKRPIDRYDIPGTYFIDTTDMQDGHVYPVVQLIDPDPEGVDEIQIPEPVDDDFFPSSEDEWVSRLGLGSRLRRLVKINPSRLVTFASKLTARNRQGARAQELVQKSLKKSDEQKGLLYRVIQDSIESMTSTNSKRSGEPLVRRVEVPQLNVGRDALGVNAQKKLEAYESQRERVWESRRTKAPPVQWPGRLSGLKKADEGHAASPASPRDQSAAITASGVSLLGGKFGVIGKGKNKKAHSPTVAPLELTNFSSDFETKFEMLGTSTGEKFPWTTDMRSRPLVPFVA